jgi:hypothetical protein
MRLLNRMGGGVLEISAALKPTIGASLVTANFAELLFYDVG